jgi:hypothetical protein
VLAPSLHSAGGSRAQIGNDFYRQMVGIPQGSVLSSLLCSFFYGDLENAHFGALRADPGSVRSRTASRSHRLTQRATRCSYA